MPEKTGLCSIVCDGVVSCQWGSSCKPINHEVTQVGCELLCCGDPCIVCASNESYEGKKAAEVFEQVRTRLAERAAALQGGARWSAWRREGLAGGRS